MMTNERRPIRVLHVEMGGVYGGSVRALELYLAHSDRSRFEHSVLFYYPCSDHSRIEFLADRLYTLNPTSAEANSTRPAARLMRTVLKRAHLLNMVSKTAECARIMRQLPIIRKLSQFIREGSFDVVHVNNTFPFQPLTLIAARFARKPVVAHVRNPVERSFVTTSLMRLCRTVATVAQAYEQQLRLWGLPVQVITCRDGVQLNLVKSEKSSALRQMIASNGLLIGSAGRLDRQKGFDVLIRAAKIVVKNRPDVRFAIAGKGPLEASLKSLAKSLQIEHHVHFCGFVEEIENFMSAIDIFVSSSNWEGLPLAVLEALLAGKPVVATDVGGTSEILRTGITGRLVPKGDPTTLARAILATIECRHDFARNVAAATESLLQFIDPVENAKAFDKHLIEALEPRF